MKERFGSGCMVCFAHALDIPVKRSESDYSHLSSQTAQTTVPRLASSSRIPKYDQKVLIAAAHVENTASRCDRSCRTGMHSGNNSNSVKSSRLQSRLSNCSRGGKQPSQRRCEPNLDTIRPSSPSRSAFTGASDMTVARTILSAHQQCQNRH
jgi:hypothetical protein